VPADAPTILATSGGIVPGTRTRWEFSGLTHHAVELAGVTGRAPRVCFLTTASGDSPAALTALYEAAELVEVLSEADGKAAYHVVADGDGGAVETRLEPRRLPG